jgi:prephenate dehydratase
METKAEGRVDSPIDSFIKLLENFDENTCPIQVSGALRLGIKLSLHSHEESLSDVKKVIGHTRALGACRKNITKLGLETLECSSNGIAIEMLAGARKGEGLAALGPFNATLDSGFKILAESFEDCEAMTTFYLLAPRIGESRQVNASRMFTVFQINHEPGSLMKVLQPLAEQGINLRMIHSFYFEDGIYRFAIETELAEGLEHIHRATIKNAQKSMTRWITFGPFPVYVE